MNSLFIEHETSLEPAGVRHGPGHDEYVPNVVRLERIAPLVAPSDPFEMPVAFQSRHLCLRVQEDRRVVFDTPHEVPRHRLCQPIGANEDVHLFRGLCEEHGRLPAELPPPITTTSWPTHNCASIGVAA
jgi:hypothetical protein